MALVYAVFFTGMIASDARDLDHALPSRWKSRI